MTADKIGPAKSDTDASIAITQPTEAVLKIYDEICKSFHAIDDFRMKLLGLLPLASLIGIFGLNNGSIFAASTIPAHEVITFLSIFSAAFTLILFMYEIRGTIRCSDLIEKGKRIESQLNMQGQFYVCVEQHECQKRGKRIERIRNFFDAKLIACFIYSFVFTAWLFMTLRFGWNVALPYCFLWAISIGLLIGVAAFLFLKKLVAA
jgi:hypothetical protein